MTPKHAKELLPIITAFAEGKPIQTKSSFGNWYDHLPNVDLAFNADPSIYRIKPDVWYRVALMDDHCAIAPSKSINWTEKDIETEPNFVRWLTDRIEYEV